MFCPNCGAQNPDNVQTCTKCGFNIKGAAAPKFKGTMLMMNQQPGPGMPPRPGGPAPLPGTPGAAPGAGGPTPGKLKGTMVGVAPMSAGSAPAPMGPPGGFPQQGGSPGGFPAPGGDPGRASSPLGTPPPGAFSPPAPQPPAAPAGQAFGSQGVNAFGGTMVDTELPFGIRENYGAPSPAPFGAPPAAGNPPPAAAAPPDAFGAPPRPADPFGAPPGAGLPPGNDFPFASPPPQQPAFGGGGGHNYGPPPVDPGFQGGGYPQQGGPFGGPPGGAAPYGAPQPYGDPQQPGGFPSPGGPGAFGGPPPQQGGGFDFNAAGQQIQQGFNQAVGEIGQAFNPSQGRSQGPSYGQPPQQYGNPNQAMVPMGAYPQQGGPMVPAGVPATPGQHGPKGQVADPTKELIRYLLLGMVTCGIYNMIWFVKKCGEMSAFLQRDEPSAVKVILLSMVTCGLYGLYWMIVKLGPLIFEMQQRAGVPNAQNLGWMYVIPYYNVILIQQELNRVWTGPM